MKIILTGPKCSGKSTIGRLLAESTGLPFVETDSHLEDRYFGETGERRSCREICSHEGEASFRAREARAAADIAARDWCVVATGGGTMLDPGSRGLLVSGSIVVLIKAPIHLLWERLQKTGLRPSFMRGRSVRIPGEGRRLYEATEHLADIVFTVTSENENDAHLVVMDGCESMLCAWAPELVRRGIACDDVRRKPRSRRRRGARRRATDGGAVGGRYSARARPAAPGTERGYDPRAEEDRVHILSACSREDHGAPICMMITIKIRIPEI